MLNSRAPDPAAWYGRYRALRLKLALVVAVLALIVGGGMWFKNKVLVIDPGKGAPLGASVRTDRHIATLIQTLVPYTPSPHRDHSKDRYRMSIFIVPLDGSATHLVDLPGEATASAYSLSKVLGSDGHVLWVDVGATYGVDLSTFSLLKPSEVRDPYVPERSKSAPFGPKVEHHLAAGLFTGPTAWLGLHSATEAGKDFKPGSGLKRVVRAENTKEQRGFYRGVLDPDTSYGRQRIVSMVPMGEEQYLNAAFLRMDDKSEPLHLRDPEGALMVHTAAPGLNGMLVVSRVDLDGNVRWSVNTGLDRFQLQQVLPGERSFAFVGTRLPEPDKVSEPVLVIVDNGTGKIVTHSLWR